MTRAEELKKVNNTDAPEGQAWKCPDCSSFATLGGNASYHAKTTGHGVPSLVAGHWDHGKRTIKADCLVEVEIKEDHALAFTIQTNDPLALFRILRAASIQMTPQRILELRKFMNKNISPADDKLLSEIEKFRDVFLAHHSAEVEHDALPPTNC